MSDHPIKMLSPSILRPRDENLMIWTFDHNGARWITDRYIMVRADRIVDNLCGLDAIIQPLAEKSYSELIRQIDPNRDDEPPFSMPSPYIVNHVHRSGLDGVVDGRVYRVMDGDTIVAETRLSQLDDLGSYVLDPRYQDFYRAFMTERPEMHDHDLARLAAIAVQVAS